MAIENLTNIASRWPFDFNRKSHSRLDHANLIGIHFHFAKLGSYFQRSFLGNNQEIAISIAETFKSEIKLRQFSNQITRTIPYKCLSWRCCKHKYE